jgi:hypothetical protein
LLDAGEALAAVERLLDRVDPDRSGVEPARRLRWVQLAQKVSGRLAALAGLLVAEADQGRAAEQATGTPLGSWLGQQGVLTRREAAAVVHRGRELGAHRTVGEAAAAGQVGVGQARAIAKVLDGLAPQLDPVQQAQAELVMVRLATHLDADQLAKSAGQVLDEVAPAEAADALEKVLQRDVEAAQRNRSFRFFREGASVRFDGSLPRVEGEQWLAMLQAQRESLRRTAIERGDRLAELPTPQQRWADALIGWIRAGAAAGSPDGSGGTGGAQVIVKLDYHALLSGAAGAGLLADGEPLSAGELRRLCCDAELVPAVLGGPSEVLDVARRRRLVTPAIRAALVLRDGGCVFPGCDAPVCRCDAHHVVPWSAGGPTALWNLVLLCHHHHAIVEPARFARRDQWEVRIAADGLPEFLPPARLDAGRRPLRHRRHAPPESRGLTDRPGEGPAPPGPATHLPGGGPPAAA